MAPEASAGEEIEPYSKHPSELKPYFVCPPPTRTRPSCLMVGTPNPRKLRAAGLPVPSYQGSGEKGGFSPEDLRDAYNLPEEGGQGMTVAITVAWDYPKAEEDLAVYREHYGLPPCTIANGCFRKVNVEGEEANYPEADPEWAEEASLDLDMVSAACPECNILLVEADIGDLDLAVEEAANLKADVISDSWGTIGGEYLGESSYDRYYDHPGIPVLFSSGDNGYQVLHPAASPDVIAVGGTSLTKNVESSRGWSEKAWKGAGSGCSAYEEKPSWQIDQGCVGRTVADISAVASPSTPVSVYDSFESLGWRTAGGTSAAAPLLAGIEALSEAAVRAMGPSAFPLIGQGGALFDPTEGNNGSCANTAYLCTAGPGYDGPTGWGTPDGPFALPVTASEGATIVSESEATLRGSVDPKGVETEYRFEYGTNDAYGTSTPYESAGSGAEPTEVAASIKGLKGKTTYHYRIAAINSEGTFHGVDHTLATTPPSATTEPGVELHGNAATLSASVNPDGAQTSYFFEYGLTDEYGSRVPLRTRGILGPGLMAVKVSEPIGPLLSNKTYHFRVVASNVAGTTYGTDETLSTPPAEWFASLPPAAEEAERLLATSCVSQDECIVLGRLPSEWTYNPVWRLHDGEWSALSSIPLGEGAKRTFPSDLSCISASRCVAGGSYDTSSSSLPLLAEWDGTEWQPTSAPMPPEAVSGSIGGVSCVSVSFCTAAGWFSTQSKGGKASRRPLVEWWDGEGWSYETLPKSPAYWGQLESVSCTSPFYCLVAGLGFKEGGGGEAGGSSAQHTLAESWDGSEWSNQRFTSPGGEAPHYSSVSCSSVDECMAVGVFESNGRKKYFVDHLNGTWTFEALPAPIGSTTVSDGSVSCPSATFCAFVAGASGATPSVQWPVAFTWSGSGWTEQSTGRPRQGGEYLTSSSLSDVGCASPSTCTATGGGSGHAMLATYPPPAPPGATTEAASAVTRTEATLNGTVNPNGTDTKYRFDYGATASYGSETEEVDVGDGTEVASASHTLTGLAPGARYHYRLVAESDAGTTYGEDRTLTTVPIGPGLEPPATFPASLSLAGEQTVSLRAPTPVTCKTESGVKALGGEGRFEDATTGTATITLHNCMGPLSAKCTSSGQPSGTIQTEALPFRLVYLSDGEPGVLFLPNAESGKLMRAECASLKIKIDVAGSGVLGRITAPALGEASPTLTIDLNAPQGEGGGYVQEYTEIDGGAEYGLTEALNEEEAKSAALEAEAVASFGGEVELGALKPPTAATEPASGVRAAKATLNGTVNPEGDETAYQFQYVDQAICQKDENETEGEGHCFDHATAVPASPNGVGSGTSGVAVSEAVSGLEPDTTYHFRVVATNGGGTAYGEDEALRTGLAGPGLEPPGGSFPAAFSLAGEQAVSLHGPKTVYCTGESEIQPLEGEGEFESAGAGAATLVLDNCSTTVSEFAYPCTSSGRATGTIATEALPFRLVYLSDGEPGVLFLPNAESGLLAVAKCPLIGEVKVGGSGVLGHIADPALGEASETLTIDLNAPEAEGGGYAQEYTETEAGIEYGLQETASGKTELAALQAEAVASFGGEVELIEGEGELPAPEPPQAATEPATEVTAEGATLNATVNPEGLATTYQFEYVDQAGCQEDVEAEGEGHCFDHAAGVPSSPKGIGSGTSGVAVEETPEGLEPGTTYRFRVVASSSSGTTYGEDETFATRSPKSTGPALHPPGGSFPASFSLAGEREVWLRGGSNSVHCKTESGVKALGGEGSFENAAAGTATLSLSDCKSTLGIKCTTPGQAEATIKSDALPIRLVYLSDGEPGVLFLPNAESGLLAVAECPLIGEVKVGGSGVLGHITDPALGEASETLTIDLNAPEAEGGGYAQEYSETEAGIEYGLLKSASGGSFEPASLEAEAVASFGGGKIDLSEK